VFESRRVNLVCRKDTFWNPRCPLKERRLKLFLLSVFALSAFAFYFQHREYGVLKRSFSVGKTARKLRFRSP
jgi:hypothetical protein